MDNTQVECCFNALDDAAEALEAAAGKVTEAACALTTLFNGAREVPDDQTAPPPVASEPKPVTLEQVRAVLADKSRDGHTAEIRELLETYGAAKLSAIDPQVYPALLAAANLIGVNQ